MDMLGGELNTTENVSLLQENNFIPTDCFIGYCGNSLSAGSVLTTSGCTDTCMANNNELVSFCIPDNLYLCLQTLIVWWCEPVVDVQQPQSCGCIVKLSSLHIFFKIFFKIVIYPDDCLNFHDERIGVSLIFHNKHICYYICVILPLSIHHSTGSPEKKLCLERWMGTGCS